MNTFLSLYRIGIYFHPYWFIDAWPHFLWCMVLLTVLHIWYVMMIILKLPVFLILVLVMYVEIISSVLYCLCLVPSLLMHVHHLCILIEFVLYHKIKIASLLIPVQSPSDCGTFIIHHWLLFIDTLYYWYLHLCIEFVFINGAHNICSAFSMLVPLPASACTCRFTWRTSNLHGIYILIVTIFVFK